MLQLKIDNLIFQKDNRLSGNLLTGLGALKDASMAARCTSEDEVMNWRLSYLLRWLRRILKFWLAFEMICYKAEIKLFLVYKALLC